MATKTFIDQDPSGGLVNAEWLNEVDAIVHDIFAGAQTVAEAKTALGLVLGTDIQAWDATLESLSALGTAADKMLYTTGVDTWAETTITAVARNLLADSSAGGMRTTLGLVIGTDVQAEDATLTSLAALGTAGDKLAYTTALDTWAETPLTSYARTLLDDVDAGAVRTTLGLGTVAVESTVPIAKGGTGQVTAQLAINALSQVSAATNEHVLTKDTATGNAKWKQSVSGVSGIKSITGTVAANALTCGINSDSLYFRNSTLTNGLATSVSFGALSLVVPSGATLGAINTIQSRLILLAINNAGTIELAAVNLSGGNNLDESGVISTTAISAASDSNNVIYSTTARANVAYRVVGYIESTQATAGTWATSPTTLQGVGGNALTAMSSLGYGQAWQDVTGSRVLSTTYYNTTGRPIYMNVDADVGGANRHLIITIDGVSINGTVGYAATAKASLSAVIPVGASYAVTSSAAVTLTKWVEMR